MRQKIGVLVSVFALVAFAGMAKADSISYTVAVTNGQGVSISDQLPVSGYLEKVEMFQSGGTNAAVVLATYGTDNTTALDTYVSISALLASGKVVTPEYIGQTSAGVDIAASALTAGSTNAATMLVANYKRKMLGGNVRFAVTASTSGTVVTNTVNLKIFFEPVKH